MKDIKAVLFDLDGTLINTIEDLADAANFALSKNGFAVHGTEDYKLMVGNGMRKLIERALPEDMRTHAVIEAVRLDFMEYYNAHSVDKTVPYQGLPQVVKKLTEQGIKIAVVTNKEEKAAKYVLSRLYPDAFEVIVGQREGVPEKPHPAGAHLAMSLLNVTPEQCAFIGDSGVDIETAVNSGALPVGVLWGFRGRKELETNGAKVILNSPAELLLLLNNA